MIISNISSIAAYDFFINSVCPTMSYVGPHALHEVIWPMPCIWPYKAVHGLYTGPDKCRGNEINPL